MSSKELKVKRKAIENVSLDILNEVFLQIFYPILLGLSKSVSNGLVNRNTIKTFYEHEPNLSLCSAKYVANLQLEPVNSCSTSNFRKTSCTQYVFWSFQSPNLSWYGHMFLSFHCAFLLVLDLYLEIGWNGWNANLFSGERSMCCGEL